MKRLAFYTGMALWLMVAASCTHDSKSPDTSGVDPQNPNRHSSDTSNRIDTGTNMNNGGTNNNQVQGGDTSLNKQ